MTCLLFFVNYIVIKCLFVCVFQGGTLMAVGLGVAAAGFAGEHNRFDPSLCTHLEIPNPVSLNHMLHSHMQKLHAFI